MLIFPGLPRCFRIDCSKPQGLLFETSSQRRAKGSRKLKPSPPNHPQPNYRDFLGLGICMKRFSKGVEVKTILETSTGLGIWNEYV